MILPTWIIVVCSLILISCILNIFSLKRKIKILNSALIATNLALDKVFANEELLVKSINIIAVENENNKKTIDNEIEINKKLEKQMIEFCQIIAERLNLLDMPTDTQDHLPKLSKKKNKEKPN